MRELRHAVGLRALASGAVPAKADTKTALPSFKQYREKDGLFYFKFVDAKGQVLLQSLGFATPKEAGVTIAQLQSTPTPDLADVQPLIQSVDTAAWTVIQENLQLLRTLNDHKSK